MSRDHLYTEYEETREQLLGISPKLLIHKTLTARLAELRKLLDGNGMPLKRFQDQRKTGQNSKVYINKYQR